MTELDEVFGVEEKPLAVYERNASGIMLSDDTELVNQAKEDRRKHYVIVNENLFELIDNVRNVVLDASTEVRTNPSARMYETFSLLAKTYAELNAQLLDLPNKIIPQSNSGDKTQPESNQVNNAIFVGTSENIIDLIKGQRL